MENNIYITYLFTDKNTNQLMRQLVVNKNIDHAEKIRKTLLELVEKYSLPESEIQVGNQI